MHRRRPGRRHVARGAVVINLNVCIARVPGAAQHEAQRSDALQTRDRYGLRRSRISGAPPSARFTRVFDALWRCTASGTRTSTSAANSLLTLAPRSGERVARAQRGPGEGQPQTTQPFVTRGLDPRVHRLRKNLLAKRMDCRVKPGNDDGDCCSRRPLTRLALMGARHPLPATRGEGSPRARTGRRPTYEMRFTFRG